MSAGPVVDALALPGATSRVSARRGCGHRGGPHIRLDRVVRRPSSTTRALGCTPRAYRLRCHHPADRRVDVDHSTPVDDRPQTSPAPLILIEERQGPSDAAQQQDPALGLAHAEQELLARRPEVTPLPGEGDLVEREFIDVPNVSSPERGHGLVDLFQVEEADHGEAPIWTHMADREARVMVHASHVAADLECPALNRHREHRYIRPVLAVLLVLDEGLLEDSFYGRRASQTTAPRYHGGQPRANAARRPRTHILR